MHRSVWILGLVIVSAPACSKRERHDQPQATASGAWYIRAQLTPQETSVLGLSITDLDSTWATGMVLSLAALPPAAAEDSTTRPSSTFGYGLSGDFNHDGRPDSAVVGVYRSRTGAKGRFALIVTHADQKWQKAFSVGMTGPTDVTFLTRGPGDTLVWNDCVECDAAGVKIYWDGRKYVAKWQDE
jgi:hypothetical protein